MDFLFKFGKKKTIIEFRKIITLVKYFSNFKTYKRFQILFQNYFLIFIILFIFNIY